MSDEMVDIVEQVAEVQQGIEPVVEEVVEQEVLETPPEPISDPRIEQLEQRLAEYENRLKPYQDQEEAARAKALDDLVNRVVDQAQRAFEPGEDGTTQVVAPEDKDQLRNLIHAGAEYVKQVPVIRQERLAATAINFAHDVVGDNATVSELRKVSEEMLQLGDPKAMELWKNKLLSTRRSAALQTRKATGADTILSSGAAAPPMNSEQALVNALVSNPDALTPTQFAKARDAMARGIYPTVK